MKITAKQIAYIHTLVSKKLGWSDEDYREWLKSNYNIDSIKNINTTIAGLIISNLSGKEATENKITPKQIGYIKFLWLSVDYEKGNSGNTLLSAFLKNKFGVGDIKNLSLDQARGAISAIKQMQRNHKNEIHVSNPLVVDNKGSEAVYVYLADGSKMLLSLKQAQNSRHHGN